MATTTLSVFAVSDEREIGLWNWISGREGSDGGGNDNNTVPENWTLVGKFEIPAGGRKNAAVAEMLAKAHEKKFGLLETTSLMGNALSAFNWHKNEAYNARRRAELIEHYADVLDSQRQLIGNDDVVVLPRKEAMIWDEMLNLSKKDQST